MPYLIMPLAALTVLLALGFLRKYQERVQGRHLDSQRYHRVADYLGRPIPLAFEYRPQGGAPRAVEADVEEIFHYGNDYFLKARSPEGLRSHIYRWDLVSRPRMRDEGRSVSTLGDLFHAAA